MSTQGSEAAIEWYEETLTSCREVLGTTTDESSRQYLIRRIPKLEQHLVRLRKMDQPMQIEPVKQPRSLVCQT